MALVVGGGIWLSEGPLSADKLAIFCGAFKVIRWGQMNFFLVVGGENITTCGAPLLVDSQTIKTTNKAHTLISSFSTNPEFPENEVI